MIVGVGSDIFEVARLRSELRYEGKRIREVIFTPNEIAYCETKRYPEQHYAARFAAKEALLKALAIDGQGGFFWQEIEVINEQSGRPGIHLHGSLKQRASELALERIHLSLSHTRAHATAHVILES